MTEQAASHSRVQQAAISAAGQQGDQGLIDNVILAKNNAPDRRPDGRDAVSQRLNLRQKAAWIYARR